MKIIKFIRQIFCIHEWKKEGFIRVKYIWKKYPFEQGQEKQICFKCRKERIKKNKEAGNE